MTHLKPGIIKINVAEFLALLITCETFSKYCAGKLTYIEVDNACARSWFDNARCPRYPYDRCAQGVHLHMLESAMKIRTRWISSADNTVADICSRNHFSFASAGHLVTDIRIRKVAPKWKHVRKFFKRDTPGKSHDLVQNS